MDSPKKKPLTSAPSEQTPTSERKSLTLGQFEQRESLDAETLARCDATSALANELFDQLCCDLQPKMSDPNWIANNPKLVHLFLEGVKATAEWTTKLVQFYHTHAQSDLAIAKDLRALAATENDPETNRRLSSLSDQMSSRAADQAEKLRETGMRAQQIRERLVPIPNLIDNHMPIIEKDGK
jgi:hypothetical protein